MSTDKHTPPSTVGPWSQSHREQPDGSYSTQVYDFKGETICTLAWYPVDLGNGVTGTAREANAQLIAAAPDMLSALKAAKLQIEYLHEKFKETGSGNQVLAQIDAAIVKAKQK